MVDITMINNTDSEELDRNIKQATEQIEFNAAIERLRMNRDFKLVITDGYFREEAIRLVHLKSAVDMQTPERQANIIKQMDAIGNLSQFFNTQAHVARLAVKALAYDEQTREDMLAEEMN